MIHTNLNYLNLIKTLLSSVNSLRLLRSRRWKCDIKWLCDRAIKLLLIFDLLRYRVKLKQLRIKLCKLWKM